MAQQQLHEIKENFTACQDLLIVLGDESRQKILLALMDADLKKGLCVNEIANAVNLSRQTVSHNLKILRNAELINFVREGKLNIYSLEVKTKFGKLRELISSVELLID